jgi:hypothetical protein
MVSTFLEAKKYPETLKVFTNTALAESWEEQGHTVEGDPLLRRRERDPCDAPEGVLVITCAVDVQGDRLELALGDELMVVDGNPFGYVFFTKPFPIAFKTDHNPLWNDLVKKSCLKEGCK